MQYVNLGRSNLKVSRLGFGAMGIGDKSWRSWVRAGPGGTCLDAVTAGCNGTYLRRHAARTCA